MPLYPDGIGCDRCFQASAEDAAEGRNRLTGSGSLLDESHFMASIVSCPDCGQRYLSIFCETVDWVDSDDPQCKTLLPLTEEESVRLTALGDAIDEATLMKLDNARRYLHIDFPKGGGTNAQWFPGGFWIRAHD